MKYLNTGDKKIRRKSNSKFVLPQNDSITNKKENKKAKYNIVFMGSNKEIRPNIRANIPYLLDLVSFVNLTIKGIAIKPVIKFTDCHCMYELSVAVNKAAYNINTATTF